MEVNKEKFRAVVYLLSRGAGINLNEEELENISQHAFNEMYHIWKKSFVCEIAREIYAKIQKEFDYVFLNTDYYKEKVENAYHTLFSTWYTASANRTGVGHGSVEDVQALQDITELTELFYKQQLDHLQRTLRLGDAQHFRRRLYKVLTTEDNRTKAEVKEINATLHTILEGCARIMHHVFTINDYHIIDNGNFLRDDGFILVLPCKSPIVPNKELLHKLRDACEPKNLKKLHMNFF